LYAEEDAMSSSAAEMADLSLVRAAERFLGAAVRPLAWLEGGDEALVMRVETDAGSLVIHASPPWRRRAELEWVHAIIRQAHAGVPQAVALIERRGQTVFEWERRFVGAFPFVHGEMLDRDDRTLRTGAARILAQIHRSLLDWPGGSRPSSGGGKPVPPPDPDELADPVLDTWWSSMREEGFLASATHGDYYRRNLLCRNGEVVAVIDWHDAVVRPLAVELSGAIFELCKDGEHRLQLDRADEFVATYLAAGGPVSGDEIEVMLPLIRLWIRSDVRSSLASGREGSDDYVAKQIRAFVELASCTWTPRRTSNSRLLDLDG
jgi:Ser/Thr protein kinase RdoA (MazF antagonist)